jgi:hypothetical protein
MTANASIRSAFHELTMTLLGLFEVYDAKPELVEHAAEEIESILRRHIGAPPYGGAPGPPGAKGKLALERLLDELEAAPETAANAH